jgi:predicted nucleic acid-binding Zn ribbon protein
MPAYDYRCLTCRREMVLVHRMTDDTVKTEPHQDPATSLACNGPLERLISPVGVAKSVGNKGPSDSKLKSLGFSKYVKSDRGYEKAFGDAPDLPKVGP